MYDVSIHAMHTYTEYDQKDSVRHAIIAIRLIYQFKYTEQ